MNWVLTTLLTLFLAISAGSPALAASMYDEDLSQLSGEVRALMVRAERSQPRDSAANLEIRKELYALSTKLHRIEEEAAGADIELQRKGDSPNRQLLLAAAISKALYLAVSSTDYFLDTRDKVFWATAVTSMQSARTLLAALR